MLCSKKSVNLQLFRYNTNIIANYINYGSQTDK